MIRLFRRAAQRAASALQGAARTLEALGNEDHPEADAAAAPAANESAPGAWEEIEVRYRLVRPVGLRDLQGTGREAFHRVHGAQEAEGSDPQAVHGHGGQQEGAEHFYYATERPAHDQVLNVRQPGQALRRRRP